AAAGCGRAAHHPGRRSFGVLPARGRGFARSGASLFGGVSVLGCGLGEGGGRWLGVGRTAAPCRGECLDERPAIGKAFVGILGQRFGDYVAITGRQGAKLGWREGVLFSELRSGSAGKWKRAGEHRLINNRQTVLIAMV